MRVSVGSSLWRTKPDGAVPVGPAGWHREIDHLLWQAQVADAGGFDCFWLTEHHFSPWGADGVPSVVLAHLACATQRIRIGYSIAVLPLHHPVRLAEEVNWIDHLSNGRLNVGVGRGHQKLEFAAFGASLDQDRESFLEGLTILTAGMSGQPVQLDGTVWKVPYLEVYPGPYQNPHPPLHMVTTSEWSMEVAVRFGATPILNGEPANQLKAKLDQFRAIARQAGLAEPAIDALTARTKCSRRLLVAESRQEAEEEAIRGQAEMDNAWIRGSRAADDSALWNRWEPASAATHATITAPTPGHDMAHIIAGTVDDIIDRVRDLEKTTGIHYLTTSLSHPGIDHAFAERNARLLVEKVLPRVA